MKNLVLASASLLIIIGLAPASADPTPIYIGDGGSGNACDGVNWQIVGFASYEECIAALGSPTTPKGDPNAGRTYFDNSCHPFFATRLSGFDGGC